MTVIGLRPQRIALYKINVSMEWGTPSDKVNQKYTNRFLISVFLKVHLFSLLNSYPTQVFLHSYNENVPFSSLSSTVYTSEGNDTLILGSFGKISI